MTTAPAGPTEPEAGVIVPSPATMPVTIPSTEGLPWRSHSIAIHASAPQAADRWVTSMAIAALWLAATAEPALKPNQPTHSMPAPATVSVITRDELNVRGVQDVNLAVAYTPNVQAVDYPGGQGGPTFTLRGFNANNFDSVYEDGLRYGFNSFDQNIEPYAYERIDVVKGPISVLYGQGQPGGIINLVSKRPTFVPFNEVFLQGGNYGRVQAGFDLSGPVEGAPQFAYRVTGLVRNADSQVKYTPDDRTFIAPAVTWRPDADTALTVLGKYAEYRGGGSEQSLPIVGSILPSAPHRPRQSNRIASTTSVVSAVAPPSVTITSGGTPSMRSNAGVSSTDPGNETITAPHRLFALWAPIATSRPSSSSVARPNATPTPA